MSDLFGRSEDFMRRSFIIAAATIIMSLGPLFGQDSTSGHLFQFGIRGGVPLTDPFETGSWFNIDFGESASAATRRYTVGPMAELRLPHGFGVEFDVLYKRLGFGDLNNSVALIYAYTNASANSWEFPILAKYRMRLIRRVRPYVDVGPSFRMVSSVSDSTVTIIEQGYGYASGPVHSSGEPHLDRRSKAGVAVGLGIALRVGILHISPEARYTRWRADQYPDPYLHSNQNQVDVLLGITF
jgi:hypothetical protein